MFAKKTVKPATAAATGPTYSWEKPGERMQELWVAIRAFDYKLFPSMHNAGPPRRMFQWEGITHAKGFEGVSVSGEVETYDLEDLPTSVGDFWKNVPSVYEGYGFLCGEDKRVIEGSAFFSLHLFCRPGVFAEIAQVFAIGVGSQHGGLGLQIRITHPDLDPGEHDYWNTRWRRDRWQVVSWEMFSGVTEEGYTRR